MPVAICIVLLVIASCKDTSSPSPPPARPPAAAASPAVTAPPIETKPGAPVSIDDATAVLPALDGPIVIPLRQTSDGRQVHGTWCIDGDGADGVARQVGRAMADAGFAGLEIRGDGRKATVAGARAGLRMAMVVSASGATTCAAPKHYFASATIFRP